MWKLRQSSIKTSKWLLQSPRPTQSACSIRTPSQQQRTGQPSLQLSIPGHGSHLSIPSVSQQHHFPSGHSRQLAISQQGNWVDPNSASTCPAMQTKCQFPVDPIIASMFYHRHSNNFKIDPPDGKSSIFQNVLSARHLAILRIFQSNGYRNREFYKNESYHLLLNIHAKHINNSNGGTQKELWSQKSLLNQKHLLTATPLTLDSWFEVFECFFSRGSASTWTHRWKSISKPKQPQNAKSIKIQQKPVCSSGLLVGHLSKNQNEVK